MKIEITKQTLKNGKIRKRLRTIFEHPSRTHQQFAEQTNVNNIMKKYRNNINNVPDIINQNYQDLANLPDLITAQNAIAKANQMFEQIPAETRFRFNNDPQTLFNFLSDEKNYEEALKLKLVNQRKPTIETETQTLTKSINELTNEIKKPKNGKVSDS